MDKPAVSIVRCNTSHKDFQDLIVKLDAALLERNRVLQSFYDQHNLVGTIPTGLIVYAGEKPVACACFKKYDDHTVEMKRMFVTPENRGLGLSRRILAELEKWALELGFNRAVIETGSAQKEAINLYGSSGYTRIPAYGPYVGMPDSVCFEKDIQRTAP